MFATNTRVRLTRLRFQKKNKKPVRMSTRCVIVGFYRYDRRYYYYLFTRYFFFLLWVEIVSKAWSWRSNPERNKNSLVPVGRTSTQWILAVYVMSVNHTYVHIRLYVCVYSYINYFIFKILKNLIVIYFEYVFTVCLKAERLNKTRLNTDINLSFSYKMTWRTTHFHVKLVNFSALCLYNFVRLM